MFKIEIKISFENKNEALIFFKSIKPELKEKFKRSETKISNQNEKLKIEIIASDKTAARASLNAVMKPLILFEEIKKIN